jgi:hypothetical protein
MTSSIFVLGSFRIDPDGKINLVGKLNESGLE